MILFSCALAIAKWYLRRGLRSRSLYCYYLADAQAIFEASLLLIKYHKYTCGSSCQPVIGKLAPDSFLLTPVDLSNLSLANLQLAPCLLPIDPLNLAMANLQPATWRCLSKEYDIHQWKLRLFLQCLHHTDYNMAPKSTVF